MKKTFLLLVVVLLLTGVSSAFALDSHANVRADFYMFDGRNEVGANGYAVFNWVKGQDAWNISGEVFGARPDMYTLSVGTGGDCTDGVSNFELLDFTVGADGYASFSAQVDNLPDEFDIARIYKQGNACHTELTAPESEGLLVARGMGRYKMADGRYHD